MLVQAQAVTCKTKLWQIAWFFTKAGAFVFGSGLAIVPFLYGGVVKEYACLN
jgi:chromate transporter